MWVITSKYHILWGTVIWGLYDNLHPYRGYVSKFQTILLRTWLKWSKDGKRGSVCTIFCCKMCHTKVLDVVQTPTPLKKIVEKGSDLQHIRLETISKARKYWYSFCTTSKTYMVYLPYRHKIVFIKMLSNSFIALEKLGDFKRRTDMTKSTRILCRLRKYGGSILHSMGKSTKIGMSFKLT